MSSFNTLVLSGGGIKGVITLGALQYLMDQYLLQGVTKFIGTSVGALLCYLLAIGYTPMEIIVYLCTTKLENNFKFFDVLSLTKGQGAISYNAIQERLEKMTIEKIGKFLTLGELKAKYSKTLICTAYNLTDGKLEYLTPDNNPDMPCLTAIRLSSNLPLIFEKYKYMGKYYIDGGVVENFPISYPDITKDEKVFGIVITGETKVENTTNILNYIYDLIYIPQELLTTMLIDKANSTLDCKILKINTKPKLSAFNLNISHIEKLNLFSRGYGKAKKFCNAGSRKSQKETAPTQESHTEE